MTTSRVQDLLEAKGIHADMISKKRNGNYLLREGFYYMHGRSADKIAQKLEDAYPDRVQVVDKGCQWKPFKGGSSIQKSSHFWVEFKFK